MTKAKTEGVQRSSADRNGGPYKRGLWTAAEDKILVDYVMVHGMGHWNLIAKRTGLKRCGKSCRLRWMNYLSPTVKKDRFSEEEEDLIIRLHKLLGNRWSLIAKRVPGRTDNQIKNYWNTHLSKKLGAGKQNSPVLKTTKSSDSTTISSGAAYGNTGPKPAKESQSSNYIEKDLDSFAEEDCVKSIWDFDHELIELSMTELLHGYTNHHHLSWPHS